jgi:Peptidase C80 family
MAYGKTFILLVTDGTGGDATARSNAGKLKWKGSVDESGTNNGVPLTRVLLEDVPNGFDTDGPATRLDELDGTDRLLVVGHGSYGDNPTLGSKSPQQLAQFLWDKGLRLAQRVSLVSCNSGWGWGDASLMPSFGFTSAAKLPFGKLFADQMGALGIHAEIIARVGYVTVLQSGRKRVELVDWRFKGALIVPKGYNKRQWGS